MKVRCIDNAKKIRNIPITEGKVYSVLGTINGCYMIVNDDGEEECYLKCRFEEVEDMEKEKVLEIEYKEVFNGDYAVRIVYQNENVLKRVEFKDDEIGVRSIVCPEFNTETLYVRGSYADKDKRCEIVNKEKLEEIKAKVEKINEKYGIPKRWRAKRGEKYWFINGWYFDVSETADDYDIFDKRQHDSGNYFKTKNEAQAKLEKIKQIIKGE